MSGPRIERSAVECVGAATGSGRSTFAATGLRHLPVLLGVATLAVSCAAALDREPVRSLAEIRHDTVVMQRWDISCGAAALATLLTYHLDDPVSEQRVAEGLLRHTEASKVLRRGGFSLLDLQEYAGARGYEANGFGQMSLDDLVEMAPAIVPVDFHGYDHFVVFRGVRGERAILADPAFGRRAAPIAEFDRVWKLKVAFVVRRPEGTTTSAASPAGFTGRLAP